MDFHFVPMNADYARTIVDNWHYEGAYRLCDYAQSESLLDPANWDTHIFAVLDEAGTLAGEFTLWLDEGALWLGFGLKPELTGRGLGEDFVAAGMECGVEHFDYEGDEIWLEVAAWNERALKVYRRLGFEELERYSVEIRGQDYDFLKMRREL